MNEIKFLESKFDENSEDFIEIEILRKFKRCRSDCS